MQYEIVKLEEKKIVGLQKKTTNQNMQAVNDIACLWQRFISDDVYPTILNKINNRVIGLYTDFEGDFTKPYNFIACSEVSEVGNMGEPLVERTIAAGKYAKFTIRGHMQTAVGELWEKIWGMDLDRMYSCDFEVYHNNSEDMNDQIIDVYISLK